MPKKPAIDQLSREELIALVRELQRQIAELRQENERLRRSQHRQAAPFSKQRPVQNPKKPGRRKGQGPFRHREAPPVQPAKTVDADAPSCCPFCGGPLEPEGVDCANPFSENRISIADQIARQPEVTLYRVAVCRCTQCGKPVRGTAAGLAAGQHGATAHRVGPGVKAAAHALHYSVGIPVRKVPGVLKELTGVTITQSALTRDALRRAQQEIGTQYQQLRAKVQHASFVHTDDTGWRVGWPDGFPDGLRYRSDDGLSNPAAASE